MIAYGDSQRVAFYIIMKERFYYGWNFGENR